MSEITKRFDVLYDLHRYEELLQLSAPACASSSEDSAEAYRYTILAFMNLERLKEALAYCNKALETFPTHVHFLYFKAFVFFKQNDSKQALPYVQEVLSHEPNYGVYHHLHAQVLMELSLYVEAKRAIDKALALDANHADFLLTLAIITYHLGNTPIACEIIMAILANEPHHAGALHLKSSLCASSLIERSKILKNILFQNPFDAAGKKHLQSIQRYYQIAPFLMAFFLLYLLGEHFEMWEKSTYTSSVLLLLSFYVWRDWRLSLPFFALCIMLIGNVVWKEWYMLPVTVGIYFFIGRSGGNIFGNFFAKIEEIIHKGKRWMNR